MGTTLTVGSLLRRHLPNGPNGRGSIIRHPNERIDWLVPPQWPPDLFCVAAALVEMSGCYADPGLLFSRDEPERQAKRDRARQAADAGRVWRTTGQTPMSVYDDWVQLWAAEREAVCVGAGVGADWKAAALRLLAVADEASREVGFPPEPDVANEPARIALEATANAQASGVDGILHMPESLCVAVPPDVACVLPKSLTPAVGCTLRSLSLNLALLPSKGIVGAQWYVSTGRARAWPRSKVGGESRFNLLLIPFPFNVLATDFGPDGPAAGAGADGYFALRLGWLPAGRAGRGQIVDLLATLVEVAEADGQPVHGIVLPETALREDMVEAVATELAGRFAGLELFVCGTLGGSGSAAANKAIVIRLEGGRLAGLLTQKKHHRWRLTPGQIRQYRLERTLPGDHDRWELIDLSDRCIQFGVGREDTVIAALVCEDLARFDPVMPLLNAVGPNLVIALLMDGPQLLARWPGRYATVLADDPGSGVLTLTSLGMLRRCRRPHEAVNRTIALWKDSRGEARELFLPEGAHALLLSLATRRVTQKTLDLRSEAGVAAYVFDTVREISLPTHRRFNWLVRSGKTT